jgi:hypothetical protein
MKISEHTKLKDLLSTLKRHLVPCVSAALLIAAALPAHATAFLSSAYYVGAEDRAGAGSDYDYNDFVFTFSGAGLTLNSNGTLSNPIVPNNDGSPFWDHSSSDGSGKNFGNCLYTSTPNACTGGSPISPSAQYLSSGGDFAAFDFSGATGQVNFTLDASLHGDNIAFYWCTSAANCNAIAGSGSFTPGSGEFYLKLIDNSVANTFTSTTSNFAVALDPIQNTPEPLSLMLTGTGLIGIYFIRRRPQASASITSGTKR